MSNITAYPLQDGFETTLAQSWNGAIGTVYLNTAPSFTFPSGVKTYIVVNPGKTNMQVGEIDSLHVGNKTVNVSSISVGSGAGTTYTQESHSVGSTVIISDNYQFWKNIVDAVNSKIDLSGGTFTGDVSFSGTGTEFRLPNLTTAERLALTPGNGTIVYDSTLGENYQYISGVWSAVSAGSTQPNASETVAGKVEEATQTQLNDGTATGETGARLFTNPSKLPTAVASYVTNNAGVNAAVKAEALEVIDDEGVESIVDRDTYLLGEPAAAGDSLFVEDMVTFASATQIQNIGDVTNNTRVDVTTAFGSGVQGSLMKLSLKKFASPSVDLNLRIETDSGGSPSGTLIDPAATASITAASLTTSLADKSIYLRDTVDADNITFNFSGSTTDSLGYRLQASIHLQVMIVNKSATCTATRCRLMTDLGVVLGTATFIGNVATFATPVEIQSGAFFRIELDNSGGAYTYHSRSGATFPQAGTNLSYISGSVNAGYTAAAFNIDSIETSFLLTIPKGTLVHLVAFQGTYNSETVNGTNYYGFGFSQQKTNTRRTKLRNGSAWSSVPDITTSAAHGVAYVNIATGTGNVAGFRVTLLSNATITTITKSASCTAGRCRIFSQSGTVLATANFSGNIATFNTVLDAGQYKLGCDTFGSTYTLAYTATAGFPFNTTYLNFTSAYNGGTSEVENIVSVGLLIENSKSFAYNSSTSILFSAKLLALTNSMYAYKLPTDVPRIATETVTAGNNCVCTTFGINNQVSGLTALSDYFIQDTDGAIGATPGTIICAIGQAIDATNLYVGKYNYSFAPVAATVYRVYNDGIIFLNVNYSSSGPETVVYVDNTDGNTTVVARSLVNTAAAANHVLAVLVKKGNFFQYTATGTVTSSFSAFYPIKN